MAAFVVVINPGSLGLALLVGTRKYEPVSITNGKLVLPIWYAFIFGMNLSLSECDVFGNAIFLDEF